MTALRICIAVLMFAPAITLAKFDASVDSTTVSEADTIRLTLRAEGTNLIASPDLSPLAKEFEVLSDQRSTQVQSINGQVNAWTTWTLLLKPKRTGALQIPAIALGSEASPPIQITVRGLDPQLKRAIEQTVFFETTYEPKQVYVQSQVVITRKLFYVNGAQLYGDMPNVPEIPGAMVKLLGEPEHTAEVRNGRQYGLIAQRFAVFPERSGDLTVPPTTVTGSVRLAESGVGGRRIGVDVTSDTLTIPVLAIPSEYPRDAAWLPATDVELLEDWPGEPERGIAVGTPSQRTLIVRAEGNAASAIPPLTMALPDSVKAYPEPPKLSEAQTRRGVVGTRAESSSLVATQPGDLMLGEVHVTWWDTVDQRVKTASLPARTIRITGTASVAPEATPSTTPEAAPASVPPQPTTPVGPPPASVTTVWSIEPWLAVAAIAALLVWLFTVRRSRRPDGAQADVRAAEAKAYKTLRRACGSADPQRIRTALDAWLTVRYALPLAEAARQFGSDPNARAAINALNACLYKRAAEPSFDPSPLRSSVDAARAFAKTARSDELPALYPST